MSRGAPPEPSLRVVDGLPAVAAELRAHGYVWSDVRERTGLAWQLPFPAGQLDEVDTPRMDDDARPPVDWLIRLLLLGDEIPSAQFDQCLSRTAHDRLAAAGLLREREGSVAAEAMLLPWEELLLACDWPWRAVASRVIMPDPSSALTAEHVAPLPGEPTATAVDVGTGCGIIAFVAARHFDRVLGVDTSARAIEFARFNAALNASDVTFAPCSPAFLEHELEAPVDLVTFVLPILFPGVWRRGASHLSQVEGGVDGRELALGTYRQLGRALRPGGRALVFHQLALDLADDLAAWLRESGAERELATLANLLVAPGEHGYARVSATKAPGGLRAVPGPGNLFGRSQTRADLLRYIATQDVLVGQLGDAVPRLYERVEAVSTAGVADGALLAPRVVLDGNAIGREGWAFAQAIDGRASVAELQRRHADLNAEGLTRTLAGAGVLYLEREVQPPARPASARMP